MEIQPDPSEIGKAAELVNWRELARWLLLGGALAAAIAALVTYTIKALVVFQRWLSRKANPDAFADLATAKALGPRVEAIEAAVNESLPALTRAVEGCTDAVTAIGRDVTDMRERLDEHSRQYARVDERLGFLTRDYERRVSGVPGGPLPFSGADEPRSVR